MIRFACPQCHKGFQVEDKAAGKRTKCPKCGAAITVPTSDPSASKSPPMPDAAADAPETYEVASDPPPPPPASYRQDESRDSGKGTSARPTSSRKKRQNRGPSIVYLGIGGVLLVVIAVGVTLWATGSLSKSQGSNGAADKIQQAVNTPQTVASPQPVPSEPLASPPATPPASTADGTNAASIDLAKGRKKASPEPDQRQVERQREPQEVPKTAQRERKQDLSNAQLLEAPPLGQGKASNLDSFASEMRKLASDEFAFNDAQAKVFRARFDQRTIRSDPVIKFTNGRNTVLYPPKYDFGSKRVSLVLHLFYEHEASTNSAGRQWPENADSCVLTTEFELDQGTARQWKEAFDSGAFVIDLWFSPVRVTKASWQENHGVGMKPEGSLSHDIVFAVKTHRYEVGK